MNRLSLLPLAALAIAIPGAALAQTPEVTSIVPSTVTRASVSARLDADYADLDADKDGKANRAEIEKRIVRETAEDLAALAKRRDESFKKLDANNDGSVSKAEFDASVKLPDAPPADPAPVLTRFDSDKDGTITLAEYRAPTLANFDQLDANKDGTLSAAEQQSQPTQRKTVSPVGR